MCAGLSAAAGKYTAKEISAGDFARQLVECMTEDVVVRSTYTPTWEPRQPLFADCRADIAGHVVERS